MLTDYKQIVAEAIKAAEDARVARETVIKAMEA